MTSTLLTSRLDRLGVRHGEDRDDQKSDARAQGNNPRFPWKPSTTMLTYRLTGTTEAPASNPDEPRHRDPTQPPLTRANTATPDHE